MKTQMLLATKDRDYAEFLNRVLSQTRADEIDLSICTSEDAALSTVSKRKYDVGLFDGTLCDAMNSDAIRVKIYLWDETQPAMPEIGAYKAVRKYQRISSLITEALAIYAQQAEGIAGPVSNTGEITAVWSPAGGVGKTTVALAYATKLAGQGKRVAYFSLESFSSSPALFPESGQSISSVFEKLDSNLELLLQAIRQVDSSTGIYYFKWPDNYDDTNELSVDDIEALIHAMVKNLDEVVVDMSSEYNSKIKYVLEQAKRILLVSDGARITQAKLRLFVEQNDLFRICGDKILFVLNRGASNTQSFMEHYIKMPQISANDPVSVYKNLSASSFDLP